MKVSPAARVATLILGLLLAGWAGPVRSFADGSSPDRGRETSPVQQVLLLDGTEHQEAVLAVPVWGYPLDDGITLDLALRPLGEVDERVTLPDSLDLRELAGNVMVGISCRF